MSMLQTESIRTGRRETLLEVAPDVAGEQIVMVNVYFVGEPGAVDRGWSLVDTGMPYCTERILRAAAARFGPRSRPVSIILTHGHFDHVGAVRELAELWDVPVFAHELEMPYLTGKSSYPMPDPTVGGGAMAWLSPLYPRGPIDLGRHIHPLPPDGGVPGMPDWLWVHTPGHAPGHVSLFRDQDRLLIAGDAFVTVRQESALAVLMQRTEIHGPPAYFTQDWEKAKKSVEVLAGLEPEVAATGHGLPVRGEMLRQGLQKLARDFDRMARPADGRYVRQPAIFYSEGVVSVPPPVVPASIRWGALGLAAIGTFWAARRLRARIPK